LCEKELSTNNGRGSNGSKSRTVNTKKVRPLSFKRGQICLSVCEEKRARRKKNGETSFTPARKKKGGGLPDPGRIDVDWGRASIKKKELEDYALAGHEGKKHFCSKRKKESTALIF